LKRPAANKPQSVRPQSRGAGGSWERGLQRMNYVKLFYLPISLIDYLKFEYQSISYFSLLYMGFGVAKEASEKERKMINWLNHRRVPHIIVFQVQVMLMMSTKFKEKDSRNMFMIQMHRLRSLKLLHWKKLKGT
jgi:hypothetical protein